MATVAAQGRQTRYAPHAGREIPKPKRRLEPKWIIASILIVLYAILPIVWILSLSLKSQATVTDGKFWPSHPSLENYKTIFTTGVFVRPLINSIGITIIATVIAVTLATLAAYAIARLTCPGKTLVLSAALAIAMFPPISIVGPIFNIWRNVGLYDTWPGLII